MPSTINQAQTYRLTRGQLAVELAKPNKKLVSREVYYTCDAAADPTTIYVVPTGKKFILVTIQAVCYRAAGLRNGTWYLYDTDDNTAPASARKLWHHGGDKNRTFDSSSTVFDYSEQPVIFEHGITTGIDDGVGNRSTEPYSFTITGWLVG